MRDKDTQGRQFRLPTEAEWEYACRAGSSTAYCFGDDPKKLGDYAWFADNSDGRPHAVGEKKPNAWGLFDMHGNILQWCVDYWGPYEGLDVKDPVRSGDPFAGLEADPIAWRIARHHVLRGGHWDAHAIYCRAACRAENGPTSDPHYGFRVAFFPD
jgi:formylglycine-generating enzyme required for sulfatase activity